MLQNDIQEREHFLFTLNWLLEVQRRHGASLSYSLANVCFQRRDVLGSVYGAPRAHRMLLDVSAALHRAFRRTDLVMRDHTDFWILLPLSSQESVFKRVREMVEIVSSLGLNIVERDIALFELGSGQIAADAPQDADEFLRYLKSRQPAKSQRLQEMQAA